MSIIHAGQPGDEPVSLYHRTGPARFMPDRGTYSRKLPAWAAWAAQAGVSSADIWREVENFTWWMEDNPRAAALIEPIRERVRRAIDLEARQAALATLPLPAHVAAAAEARSFPKADAYRIAAALVRSTDATADQAAAAALKVAEGEAWHVLSCADSAALERLAEGRAVVAKEQAEHDKSLAEWQARTWRGVQYDEPAFDLEWEPGLLGDVARWCSASAFRPVPEFALPATLGFLAALFGRRFATPTGLGLNLYLVGLAQTGGGKDALVSAPKALLSAAGFRHLIGPGDFTSDAAIEMAVRTRPVQVMCIDEFGKLAQAMTGRAAPHFAKLAAKALLELYPRSAPRSEWTGKQRVGDGRDSAGEPVFSPTLSLVGVSTPAGFFEGMTEATLEDGMLNRLTLVVGGQPGPRQKDPDRLNVPSALVEAIEAAYEASSAGNLAPARSRDASAPQSIRCVPWADAEAEAAIEIVEAWEDDARDAGRAGICGRAAEQTQKVATLRALARDPASPAVTAEDVEWAWSFVRESIGALEEGARQFMASSAFEELVKAIEREVMRFGWAGIPLSKLLETKACAKSEPRLVDAALTRLQERGVVIVDNGSGPKGGRPGKRIRLRNQEGE